VPQGSPKGLPFDSASIAGEVTVTINGVEITTSAPVSYRFADQIRGELRRIPAVVPPISVGLDTIAARCPGWRDSASAESRGARIELFFSAGQWGAALSVCPPDGQ
jgi:hypothetical protein